MARKRKKTIAAAALTRQRWWEKGVGKGVGKGVVWGKGGRDSFV